jgi:hypothetical protein
LNDLEQSAPEWHDCSRSDFESLAHHSHAQPLAIEGQKKNGGTIYSSRRLMDVGNRRGDFDGPNVAGPVWIPEFRYGLRIPPGQSLKVLACIGPVPKEGGGNRLRPPYAGIIHVLLSQSLHVLLGKSRSALGAFLVRRG